MRRPTSVPFLLAAVATATAAPSCLITLISWWSVASVDAFAAAFTNAPAIVTEAQPAHITLVSELVSSALGDGDDAEKKEADARYASVRDAVSNYQRVSSEGDGASPPPPSNELVYGELSVPVMATILDAVGVQEDDVFLDVGSGDGALVLGASLLYASSSSRNVNAMQKCCGVEIVPGLVDRSDTHAKNLEHILQRREGADHEGSLSQLGQNQAEVKFLLGDIHQPNSELESVLAETTLAVCFATTWSAGNAASDGGGGGAMTTSLQGRRLPKLSRALSETLTRGCRVVIIDGKLDESDGFSWMGDLRVQCPDTAPYSVASLYHRQ